MSGRFPEMEVKLSAYVTYLCDQLLLVTCETGTQQALAFAAEA